MIDIYLGYIWYKHKKNYMYINSILYICYSIFYEVYININNAYIYKYI